MQPAHTLSTAEALRAWVHEHSDESSNLVALIDPSRYADAGACAQALGFEWSEFDVLPNLYSKYSRSIRDAGPRLWTGARDDPRWARLYEEAFDRQAASFLVVTREAGQLEEHLSGLVRMPQPDGGSLLFRFQDVVVLTALAPLLRPEQRLALLGPASGWLMADLCHRATSIERPRTPAVRRSLRLDQPQIDALGEALVPLTIIFQANETDSTLLMELSKCEQVQVIRERIHDARQHGLNREDDIALYCVLSLQLPKNFDLQGPVAEALQQAQSRGIGFGEAIDEVPVERWRAWDEELNAHAPERTKAKGVGL